MRSRFLPSDFNFDESITLLAGRGQYPVICARHMVKCGAACSLIASEDSSPEVWELFPPQRRARFNPGQIGRLLKKLKEFGSPYAIMAGQIAPKRLFHGLKFDMTALRMLARLKERNAESIFGALAAEIERHGVRLLDARSFMDDDVATAGFMTSTTFSLESLGDGIRVAGAIAALNVGQGIVVRRGTVLAVEGFDGTDKMLLRCGEFHTNKKCFIKTSKPRQDFRFDVPIVGLATLAAMEAGGIRAMALESENTILLNRMELLAQADRRSIGIYGYVA
ncbi:MAG: UDP-2,3-diacylglucosamine diphosphatase LpxI [Puniceicoccales bacterium]|nr:UDP-2,3-diacylglucosamine diphosphatase LpxI [Puniceicoccales bacterium]